jgi:CRP-like cAMP-binding protein
MPSATRRRERPRNWILAGLPAAEWRRLEPHLERVEMRIKQVLFDPHQRIEAVYFVERGVASIVGILSDGSAVETATIGPEGMVGVSLLHGVDRVASQAFCQVAGEAYRLRAEVLTSAIRRPDSAMRELLGRYTECLFALVAQSSACNRIHPILQRCARWLLMTQDRVGGDEFSLTQQFLSQMLGVRRASVTEAARVLQQRGLIEYQMGVMRVLDRRGLESTACECYRIVRNEFARLLEGRVKASPVPARVSERGMTLAKEPRTGKTSE